MTAPAAATIRKASVGDLDALLDLHYRVFDEHTHLAMLLGRDFLHAAYEWYTRAPDAFTLVAEIERRLEGSCTVNRGSYYTVFHRNVPALARAVLRKPAIVFHPAIRNRLRALLTRPSGQADPDGRGDHAYLAYLAVSQAAWGTGTGRQLSEAAIAECRQRGWGDIVTAIHRTNLPARFMYRTLGFEDFPPLTHDDLVGVRLRNPPGVVPRARLDR